MSSLDGVIDHPVAFLVSLALSAPFVWVLAQMFFRNIAEELRVDAPYYLADALLPGWSFLSWPAVKLIFVLFFSAAVMALFYRLCAWVGSWTA
jgi:hypothetical protein